MSLQRFNFVRDNWEEAYAPRPSSETKNAITHDVELFGFPLASESSLISSRISMCPRVLSPLLSGTISCTGLLAYSLAMKKAS